MHSLKQYRRTDRGLPDYLNWAGIAAPGIIQGKDGSLLAGRFFRGRNLAHATDVDWEAVSDYANRAFGKLSGGWSIWIDAIRHPVNDFTDPARNHFPSAIPALIEAERHAAFTQDNACLESDYAILLHYMPPLKHKHAIINLIYSADDGTQPSAATTILQSFRRALDEFDEQFNAAVELQPMQDHRWTDDHGHIQLRSELVNYLQFLISNEWLDIPLPPHGCYLDGIIGEKSVDPGVMPKVGDTFIAVVALSGYPFPKNSSPGLLYALDLLPFPLRWSSRYIVLDQPEAEKQGQIIENKWKHKARGLKGIFFPDSTSNPDAAKMAFDAGAMIERTQSALEGNGYYTANVILTDKNPAVLEEQARLVRRTIRDAGFPSRLEDINAMEAWLGSLGGHCVPNVRRPPLHTTNLADLVPLAIPWLGHKTNPCPYYPPQSPPLMQVLTAGRAKVDISFHDSDRGHCLIFGPIGSGKSTLLSFTALSALRYPNAMVWGFDKGRTLMPAFRATGRYYDIGNDKLASCPLSVLEDETDVAWAEEWIATCFHLQTGRAVEPQHTEATHYAIQALSHSTNRSLHDFVRQVQNPEVRDAMAFYTLSGSAGHLFDAKKDGLEDSLVCGFEIAELMGMGERIVIPFLSYAFRRFARMLKGQPAYLLIDEAWTMLGHPVWRDKLREWLKELRKANCAVVMATQSLDDAVRSGLLSVLLESCPTRIYGANPAALTQGPPDEPGPYEMYRTFGLNDAQIEMIRQAIPKKHYLFTTTDGSALIDLQLGKQALKFTGAGSKEALAQIDRLYREHGDSWAQKWLEAA